MLLPAHGSILLLSEPIGIIDANVYLFKNTEDGVSLKRLNIDVDGKRTSDVIYELTDSNDAELIQQISVANGSDNNLAYVINGDIIEPYSDLMGADLSNLDLSYDNEYLNLVNLNNANLTSANLTNSNLQGVNLEGVNLSYAELSGATLQYTNLIDANLYSANLADSFLSSSNLTNAS